MKRSAIGLALIGAVLCSCATTPSPAPGTRWEFEKDAISLNLKADKQLNLKDRKAHNLALCVYQLKNPNAFSQLSGDRNGLYQLLECQVFDPSVATSQRVFVNPGKDVSMKLDRAEGATYVAVVAGYYGIDKAKIVRLYKVPVVSERKGVLLKKVYKPGRVNINLILGPLQLQDPAPAKKS